MRSSINNTWEENGHALPCPHCGNGADELTVGLYWSSKELCWKCVICGYRKYRLPERPRNQAEIRSEELWDSILDALDEEEKRLV